MLIEMLCDNKEVTNNLNLLCILMITNISQIAYMFSILSTSINQIW
jgi:hypothetical protein